MMKLCPLFSFFFGLSCRAVAQRRPSAENRKASRLLFIVQQRVELIYWRVVCSMHRVYDERQRLIFKTAKNENRKPFVLLPCHSSVIASLRHTRHDKYRKKENQNRQTYKATHNLQVYKELGPDLRGKKRGKLAFHFPPSLFNYWLLRRWLEYWRDLPM